MITGKQLVQKIEQFAPLKLKMKHDPTGLQLGNLDNPVQRVLTTLDVRPEVVAEAIELNVDFIFVHHPVIFRPAYNLDTSNPQNKMYADLLKHDITVYAAHTNLDRAPEGMNDWLAQFLQLSNIQPFAFDEDSIALGRLGTLTEPMSVVKLSHDIKQKFNLSGLRLITNNDHQMVQRVGIIGGDGGKFYPQAILAGVDVFITGDVYYHTAHDMLAAGLSVIDPGHHVESIFKVKTQALLQEWSNAHNWSLTVLSSQYNTDPFTYL